MQVHNQTYETYEIRKLARFRQLFSVVSVKVFEESKCGAIKHKSEKYAVYGIKKTKKETQRSSVVFLISENGRFKGTISRE